MSLELVEENVKDDGNTKGFTERILRFFLMS